jgi:hypothetical protein
MSQNTSDDNSAKEQQRLREARESQTPWKKWGPYLSERQWGTVREDYSESGDAWSYFTHDQARSRAYRWGEDGIAGISDDKSRLCFALALWNGKDPIIKERLFGLTGAEGNHGEDVKEYYFYLDSTPTHSYMKYLYKYPQRAYPYAELVEKNRGRSKQEPEYELLDTGVFKDDRYFDVFVEYAKGSPEDILVKISIANRGPEAAKLHVLPTLWYRNNWASWTVKPSAKPMLKQAKGPAGTTLIEASNSVVGEYSLYCQGDVPLLFTDNETNNARLFPQYPNESPYVKDGINDYLVHGKSNAVNPKMTGTKVSPHYQVSVDAGKTAVIRLRLKQKAAFMEKDPFGAGFEEVFTARLGEADEFYKALTPPSVSKDEANVMRQALAGMLWSKQYFYFDVEKWLKEHNANPFDPKSRGCRNKEWFHLVSDHVISMPDKWEYPWYAAWDLAFHCRALMLVDPDFAKEQLDLLLKENFLHPSGQLSAYEWNFSDVNPPVHAWATLVLHQVLKAKGQEDFDFLKRVYHKLLLNFTWWVNRKDRNGKNVFDGGFLGLDNIGVFDRSKELPTGGHLEQADGTAWMALFCQNMADLSIHMAVHDKNYEEMVVKFIEHFIWIANSMNRSGEDGMWDEEDGFYYDRLLLPNGNSTRLKVRSVVGLLPLCATTVIESWQREQCRSAVERLWERVKKMPEMLEGVHVTGPGHLGVEGRGILALVNEKRLRRILSRMLDEKEFLSDYGIRALSKFHEKNPYVFYVGNEAHRVGYVPGDSDSGMFGGNSNWRGPIWMPVNGMILRALQQYYLYYGDNFKIECPTGSGKMMNLFEVAQEIAKRLTRIFTQDKRGWRPTNGVREKCQTDPYWKDYVLFYEYFHGDTGAGIGASHQTGWTGIVAPLIEMFGTLDAKTSLRGGMKAAFERGERVSAASKKA